MSLKNEEVPKKKHTYKNYPFLLEMKKDNWIINVHNKSILIWAYCYGLRDRNKSVAQAVKELKGFILCDCDQPILKRLNRKCYNCNKIDEVFGDFSQEAKA